MFVEPERRSLVTEVGSAVAGLEEGLGVTAVEEKLDALLGTNFPSFAEYMLGLSDKYADPGVVQAVGEGIAMLEEGLGVTAVNEYLDNATGGTISSIEEVLGVTDVEEAPGLA
ncbi:hypothetical protein PG994_010999 [Apiospora phragmitis]|uniref:Uncharacterized protein n=1 Tax=Apiospora phragmitis TaxID=2905665 RepID=A0ABR1TRN4_9PEZI